MCVCVCVCACVHAWLCVYEVWLRSNRSFNNTYFFLLFDLTAIAWRFIPAALCHN